MDGLQVSAADYRKFFNKTQKMSGRLRTRVRKRVRDSGKKYGREIVEQGAEKLPSGGGLADAVAAKGRNPTVKLTSTGAQLVLGKKKGPQIGRMDEGNLRHPVFYVWWKKGPGRNASALQKLGHKVGLSRAIFSDPKDRKTWKWVAQDIPKGSFTDAAKKYFPEISGDVAHEINEVLKELG